MCAVSLCPLIQWHELFCPDLRHFHHIFASKCWYRARAYRRYPCAGTWQRQIPQDPGLGLRASPLTPAIWFAYLPERKEIHPQQYLAGCGRVRWRQRYGSGLHGPCAAVNPRCSRTDDNGYRNRSAGAYRKTVCCRGEDMRQPGRRAADGWRVKRRLSC